jgi:CubicO group peptidase (beta-lactamase class C family)
LAGVALARAVLAAAALGIGPTGGAAQEPVSLPRLAAPGSLADDSVDAIRAAIPDGMSRFGIPGLSLAVARGGTVRFEAGFGFSDIENEVRARPETVYRLASVSKPITAVVVMKLAEQGRLDLDAPVWRYCPDFPEKPWPVTSRQLLCHQGGVRHYRPGEQPMTRRFTSLGEGLALFRDDRLEFEPGTKVLYTTYGYTVLGCAAAMAAGRPFPSLLQDTVLEPARMTATRLDDVRELIPHRAGGYVRDGYGRLLNSALADMSHKVPGAGLCATAPDVARFGAALLGGRIVSRETLRQMLTRQKTRDGQETGYGLGLSVGTRGGRAEAWHTGGHERVSTVLYLRPDDGLAVGILANLEKAQGEILALARRVADLVTARTAVSSQN